MITVLAGGVGAARFLTGLQGVTLPSEITAIVNVGDDLELHGLNISPDIDTITYTLAGIIDPERGWGLAGETWQAMSTLATLGGSNWFNLGDRDLGTHLYRTARLRDGATLSDVTAEIAAALGVGVYLIPASNDPLRTIVTINDNGRVHDVSFQEYFVKRSHSVPVTHVQFAGAETSTPSPGVLDAIRTAERLVIAPSNPIVSIDPVLAVPGVRDAVTLRRTTCIAISPIVAGAALKGPADRLMRELGHEASVVGIAKLYAPLAATLIIDEADAHLAKAVADEGMKPIVAPTIMSSPNIAAALGELVRDLPIS